MSSKRGVVPAQTSDGLQSMFDSWDRGIDEAMQKGTQPEMPADLAAMDQEIAASTTSPALPEQTQYGGMRFWKDGQEEKQAQEKDTFLNDIGLTPDMTAEQKGQVLQKIDDTKLEAHPELYRFKYNLRNYSVSRFKNKKVEPQKYTVRDIVPKGVAEVIASDGGLGKGMSMLDLGNLVATPPDGKNRYWLGHLIEAHGPVVYITAEDSEKDIQRRLASLKSDLPKDFMVLSLPDVPSVTGTYFRKAKDGNDYEVTPLFHAFWEQLKEIKPALVIIDPLRCMTTIDTDKDNPGAAFIMKTLSKLAMDLDASILVCHHVRKPSQGGKGTNEDDARSSIAGGAALVNEVRGALAMWRPSGSVEDRCKALGLKYPDDKKRILNAMLVKANFYPADERLMVLVRRESGRLEDVTEELQSVAANNQDSLKSELLIAIRSAAKDGITFTCTGANSIFSQKMNHSYFTIIRKASRRVIEGAVNELLDAKRLTIEAQHLVVPESEPDDAPNAISMGELVGI